MKKKKTFKKAQATTKTVDFKDKQQRRALNMQIGSIKFMCCHFNRERIAGWLYRDQQLRSNEIKINDV